MQEQGTVAFIDAQTGRFALRVEDGSYILAEQLDVQPLQLGTSLSGEMDTVGTETFNDVGTAAKYGVYILAYGLSREAVEQELR
jgi:hypothetical protein